MAAWTHIAHSALSLPAATVTWTGISGSYDHLYLKMSTRCDAASYQTNIFVNFNSDTGTNTANFKQTLTSSVSPNNSTTDSQWLVNTTAGLWGATPAAIHTILLTSNSSDFVAQSTFDLYGILGA